LHIIEENAELAMTLFRNQPGETVETPTPPLASLPLDAAQEDWAREELRQSRLTEGEFAIINPGAGWQAKCWPAERYGQVARGVARMGIRCLVNCGPGEEVAANDVMAASGGSAVVRQFSIGQLIAITRRARLFVGGDTGPMHLAAALRVPVVGIFGPTSPSRNGPYGTAAEVLRNPESVTNHSRRARPDGTMLSITVEAVLAKARALLERTSHHSTTPKPDVAGTPQEAQRG
jgi:heptosyltransferase-1